jgi:hypothetical protein
MFAAAMSLALQYSHSREKLPTFDITMQLLVPMEVFQAAQKFPQDDGNVLFVNHSGTQQTMTAPT